MFRSNCVRFTAYPVLSAPSILALPKVRCVSMRIAVVGCVHGNLSVAYAAVARVSPTPDLVIMCGDVQACRTPHDLLSMSVPVKYRRMGDFHKFHSGERRAPVLTLIVGGNHEASGFMSQFENGGWIAENMYYLGNCGLVKVGDLVVCGLSGVYYAPHAQLPRFEAAQFANNYLETCDSDAKFSAYHVRAHDVEELAKLPPRLVDVMVTHDWPAGIERYGKLNRLLKQKPFFREDIKNRELGNPLTFALLNALKPQWWFAAHLHVKYTAKYKNTRFLALDKVMRGRHFLEVVDVEPRKREDAVLDGVVNLSPHSTV